MRIYITSHKNKPIYEQIKEQIKEQILTGSLNAGDVLPSIRGLARELKISVITTKRAYEDLEREGVIYTAAGKGSFVADKNKSSISEEYRRRIEDNIDIILSDAKKGGVTLEEIIEIIERKENLYDE